MWLSKGTHVVVLDYEIVGSGDIYLYNFSDSVSIGYAYGITNGGRGNIVRVFQLDKSCQIGVHVENGTVSRQGYAISALRTKQ